MDTHDNKRGRREPTLGDLDHLDAPPPRVDKHVDEEALPSIRADTGDDRPRHNVPPRPSRRPPHRQPSKLRSWLWLLLTILVVVLLALAWINQGRLRAMLPRTQLNATLVQADKALAAGHLEGADGTSAHELYAKVLKEEPDNGHALKGLRKVGEAELARATSAIRAGNYQQAAVSIANARQLLGGGADVERVADALQKAQLPTKRLHGLIAKAQQALAAGKVTGDDGAASLYRQVLNVNPQSAVARHGLDRAGDALVTRARAALQSGDVESASALVAELGTWLPHQGDLPSLRAQLSQAKQQVAAIQAHLASGENDLHQGHFTGNGGDNALTEFQAVLKLDPDNAKAQSGLQQVARALVLRANAAIDAGDADQARQLLEQAAQLAPQSPEVAAARARLQNAPQTPTSVGSQASVPAQAQAPTQAPAQAPTQAPVRPQVASAVSTVSPAPTPLQKVEIRQLIRRAQTAADGGHIMLPPGASAYDLYRRVLSIDPDNAAAGKGLDALANQVLKRFNQAMAAHDLEQAGSYLASMQSLEPGSLRATTLSQRLGNAWLDRAQRAADKGDHAAAVKALDAARKLQPDPTRLQALETRLRNG